MNTLLNKLIKCFTNLIQYILADRLLYVWIPFLLSISIFGGIIFPVYLITFFVEHKDPQFFNDLYNLDQEIHFYNKSTNLNDLSDQITELIKEYKKRLTEEQQIQKNLNKEEINNLKDPLKQERDRLYLENCKDDYDNVVKVLLYLSLTFVIIAAFSSF